MSRLVSSIVVHDHVPQSMNESAIVPIIKDKNKRVNDKRNYRPICLSNVCSKITIVPALGDPRRERPPAVYGHVINVPTYFNVLIRPSDERPPALYGQFCLVPMVSVHDRYYCI